MTRSSMNRVLMLTYIALGAVLSLAFVAKLGKYIPGIADTFWEPILADTYVYLRDMSIVLITLIAAYLANVFQKRSSFTNSLEREWRRIVKTKTALLRYTRLADPKSDDYEAVDARVSEALDNMRTVYKNVGETRDLIGLYPFTPLHDMRRALQTLNPEKSPDLSDENRTLVRDSILQSFYALREHFLDELDLQQPDKPILTSGAKRQKKSGAILRARVRQKLEARSQRSKKTAEPEPTTALLQRLHAKEHRSPKRWRKIDDRNIGKVTATDEDNTSSV